MRPRKVKPAARGDATQESRLVFWGFFFPTDPHITETLISCLVESGGQRIKIATVHGAQSAGRGAERERERKKTIWLI